MNTKLMLHTAAVLTLVIGAMAVITQPGALPQQPAHVAALAAPVVQLS